MTTLSFDSLPEEVLRSIIGYMDVASLGVLSMTHRPEGGTIAAFAIDDVTWYALIQSRFGIGFNHRKASRTKKHNGVAQVTRGPSSSLSSDGKRGKRRPTTYGGLTWKDSFRSLSSTMRIPETRITTGSHTTAGVFASPHQLRGRTTKNSVADFFGVWCMVNHAENCRTKTVRDQMGRMRRRRRGHDVSWEPRTLLLSTVPYRTNRRYIELKLCLQNTKSGYGRVVIPDILAIRIASVDEDDYFNSWGWDRWNEEYESTFQMIKVGPWAPRMLLRRRFGDENADPQCGAEDIELWNAAHGTKDIILHPFEVVVLSIHISCPDGQVYETDVLSSMSCIRVPIIADGWPSTGKYDAECCGKGIIKNNDVSISRFLSEDALWEYYCQLPGGCLSLTDRSRLVPM